MWTNPRAIEAVILSQWKMMRVPLESITPYPDHTPYPLDPAARTGLIQLREPAWTNANVFLDASILAPGIRSFWQVTRFENAYEFLDEPGEWYLDEATGWLYYIPAMGRSLTQPMSSFRSSKCLWTGRARGLGRFPVFTSRG